MPMIIQKFRVIFAGVCLLSNFVREIERNSICLRIKRSVKRVLNAREINKIRLLIIRTTVDTRELHNC